MITFNEEHNMHGVLDNIINFASEVFIVDSYSSDKTVEIAHSYGVRIFQRKFINFGDQWNFACTQLPISNPWSMKLDPDERMTDVLKDQIVEVITHDTADYISIPRRLWFMNRPLPVKQNVERVWRTGKCRFTELEVNEHPILSGKHVKLTAWLEHYDSPNLHHWYNKQNRYTTLEAKSSFVNRGVKFRSNYFGTKMERRQFFRDIYNKLAFKNQFVFIYCYLFLGAFRAGRVGFIWARMRSDVYRMREIKHLEMILLDKEYIIPNEPLGKPSKFAEQLKFKNSIHNLL